MKLRPLGDRILVKPDAPPDRTRGGIIIPESAKKKTLTAVVVAMGPGMLTVRGDRWPMPDVEPGDRVHYPSEFSGAKVLLDGVEHLMLRDTDILAVEAAPR